MDEPGDVPEALRLRAAEFRDHARSLAPLDAPESAADLVERLLAKDISMLPNAPAAGAPPGTNQAEWYEAFAAAVRLPAHKLKLAWRVAQTEAVCAVQDWLRGDYGRCHLLLSGASGCGKTFAEAAAVRHWTEPGRARGGIAWLTADQLISAMLHSYDPAAPKLARNVIVDDIGRETKAGLDEALCKLLEEPGKRRILMSTNHPRRGAQHGLVAFAERYDSPALRTRFEDEVHPIWLTGTNLRGRRTGWE